jgi:hypothetical protein
MTDNKMIQVNHSGEAYYSYLVDAAATTGGAPYISWHYARLIRLL